MLALKHDSLRKLGIAAGWFILAGVFRQLDHALSPLLSAMCFLATNLIYIALALVWGISVRRRILHRDVRRYLLLSCAMAVLWLLLRAFKYRYFQSDGISRALWYCYYIPQIFAPLFGFFWLHWSWDEARMRRFRPTCGWCMFQPAGYFWAY